MEYLFGPVPSRRLGRSLGIDPTPPSSFPGRARAGSQARANLGKACNWNCVYCQLGRTRPFVRARASFFPPSEMIEELRAVLGSESGASIDWISFVGSGEPTLNLDLGRMIRDVKALCDKPVAVITNGSLLELSDVRSELSAADAVMPSLDAGRAGLFRRINRPPSESTFQCHLDGLQAFRREYTGKLWLEVMLVAGLNDGEEALGDLAAAVASIAPDEIHLVLPTRPPAEPWVRPSDSEGLLRASAILGEVAPVLHPDQRRGEFGTGKEADPLAAAAAILARHPMSDDELRKAFSAWGAPDPEEAIRLLAASGRATRIERYGMTFWRGAENLEN